MPAGAKEGSDALKLELQALVTYLKGILRLNWGLLKAKLNVLSF